MTPYKTLLFEIKNQVATVTLNRPELHNAFNEELILELTQAFQDIAQNSEVRVALLTGAGASFSAGGDLNWMKRSAAATREENIQEAKKLHRMLTSIAQCPKPVLAKVNGTAMGGGVGLTSAVDIAFAYKNALFALSEVRLGLAAAVISPFVIRKIGAAKFRELALTAERFSAGQAREIGLVQQSGDPEQIDELIEVKIAAIKAGGPEALAATKKLIDEVQFLSLDQAQEITPVYLAERRASKEGQEGIAAFLEKRKPNWVS
ncbi:MAG: enoyl-CoA hydratase/isomerase family protein [Deltaproteobacteria bacterium]|nr:enoyl-CoA hydratase/isomerase family protein [Deltaproteobacteria bacterium]